jgi:tight adherence protein B
MTVETALCAGLVAVAVGLVVPASPGARLARLEGARLQGGRLRGARVPGQPGVVVAAAALAAVASTPGVALVAVVAVVLGTRIGRRVSAARAGRRAAAAVPEACARIARLLRAGELPHRALRLAAPGLPDGLGRVLREAAAAADIGGSVVESLRRDGECRDALAPVAACWSVAAATGAPLAPALAAVAAALTAEHQHRRALDAELAGPRLTGWLLAGLPVFGVAVAASLGGRPTAMLLGTPLGLSCLLAAAALDGVGVWWLRRLGGPR